MDAKDLLLDSLDEREATYREELKKCRDDFSKSAVHDLRTSIRRLFAVLDVVGFFTSDSDVEKVQDRLKEQLAGVGDLRDVQVLLDRIAADRGALPELGPFQGYLEKREKRERRAGEKHVGEIKPGGVKKRLRKLRQALEDLSAEELNGKLPQAVDQAYLTVVQRYGEVDPSRLVSIHHLRVAFKKFRYMLEVIHPCLPGFPASQLQRMHDHQTRMGTLHDTEVLLETLAEFAKDDESYDPAPVRRFYERTLADALSAYLQDKEQVLTFWRPTPLAAFPWETDRTKEKE
jgi:CHAD domain-containing protein